MGSILIKNTFNFSLSFFNSSWIKDSLFKVIGQTSGQLVKPKNNADAGPSKDFSVIILLFTSFNSNDEPVIDATYSSF